MEEGRPALIVVDMQHYYLQKTSAYWAYFNALQPGCLDYIANRCETIVIPNIRLLLQVFRSSSLPPVFLRLCGKDERWLQKELSVRKVSDPKKVFLMSVNNAGQIYFAKAEGKK